MIRDTTAMHTVTARVISSLKSYLIIQPLVIIIITIIIFIIPYLIIFPVMTWMCSFFPFIAVLVHWCLFYNLLFFYYQAILSLTSVLLSRRQLLIPPATFQNVGYFILCKGNLGTSFSPLAGALCALLWPLKYTNYIFAELLNTQMHKNRCVNPLKGHAA